MPPPPPHRPTVNPTVEKLAGYAWRFIVITVALLAVLWLAGRLWSALLPVGIALLLARVLWLPYQWVRRRGLKPALASAVTLLSFLAVLGLLVALIGVAVVEEFNDLGPAVAEAVESVQRWLVEDSPFDVSREDLDRFQREATASVRGALRTSSGEVISGAVVAGEVLLGLVVGLIVTFFALKDGERFLAWVRGLVPAEHRETVGALGSRAWRTLGGYLRGAAILGFVEGAAIGITLALVGARLAVPMALVTFLAAFVPFAGAIVSGVLATLVALGTAGLTQAVIVAVVALAIQQLDNDLLAPVVYGRALEMHPVVIVLAIIAGGGLIGLAGTFLAVPVTAVAVNMGAELRSRLRQRRTAAEEGDGADGAEGADVAPAGG